MTDQKQKFIEAAREHGCDEREETFAAALKTVSKQKPKLDDKQK